MLPQQLYKPFHPIYLYNAKSLESKTPGTSAHSWWRYHGLCLFSCSANSQPHYSLCALSWPRGALSLNTGSFLSSSFSNSQSYRRLSARSALLHVLTLSRLSAALNFKSGSPFSPDLCQTLSPIADLLLLLLPLQHPFPLPDPLLSTGHQRP